LKALFANLKAHPVQFLVVACVFAMFFAVPFFALVNKAKSAVPVLGTKIPDLKVKS
jgi:hypothetical protein